MANFPPKFQATLCWAGAGPDPGKRAGSAAAMDITLANGRGEETEEDVAGRN